MVFSTWAWSKIESVSPYDLTLPASCIRSAATSKQIGTGATNGPMVSIPSSAKAPRTPTINHVEDPHTPSGAPQSSGHDGPDGNKCTNEWNSDDEDDLFAIDLNQRLRNSAAISRDREGGYQQSRAEND